MPGQPLVSAILRVYDRERWAARTNDSVLRQAYPRVEFIVVDDGSIDGTSDALASYRSRLAVLRQPHCGPYIAPRAAPGRWRRQEEDP